MIRNIVILCAVIAMIPVTGISQEQIRGAVVESTTGLPVPGVTVWLPSEQRGTTTGPDGEFILDRGDDPDPVIRVQGVGFITKDIRLTEMIMEGGRGLIRIESSPVTLEPTIITAARREQSLSTVPVSVSTIDAKDLSGRISVTLEEPLRYVSGVHVMDDQVNIRGSSGYSRGVGSRVLLLFDGMPLLTGDTGEIIWEMVPVEHIDRVEIVKGAGSALYGSGALGGVINVIPAKIPDGSHAGIRLSGSLYEKPAFAEWVWSDRHRTLSQGSILYSYGAPSWGTVTSATRWMDESHRQNDVTHRYAFYNRSEFRLSDAWMAQFTGHYVHRKGGNFFWWKSLQSPLVPPEDYANRQVFSDRGFVALTLRGIHASSMTSSIRLQYYSNAWSDEDKDVVTTDARSSRLLVDGQLTFEILQNLHVVTGAAGYLDQVRSNIFGTHPGFGGAAFVQSEYGVLPGLQVSLGVRFDWQQVSGLASGSQIDPRIGAAYRVSDDLSLRASAGTGFRYPSIGELYTAISTGFGGVNVVPNPALKPERSMSVEVGTMFRYARHAFIDIALFQSSYDRLIEAAVDAQQLVIRFDNVERARVSGLEASLEHGFLQRNLVARLGYTFMDPRNVTTHEILRFRPRHLGVVGLTARYGPLDATAEYRYVSRIDAIDENLVAVAEITDGTQRTDIHAVNLRASWVVTGLPIPLRVGCEIRNGTNHQYVELLANLAPPRTYMITLETML